MRGHKVDLLLPESGASSGVSVRLDGREIRDMVRALSVHCSVDSITVVTLEMPAIETYVDGQMMVRLDEHTSWVLQQLGWTPPEHEAP